MYLIFYIYYYNEGAHEKMINKQDERKLHYIISIKITREAQREREIYKSKEGRKEGNEWKK